MKTELGKNKKKIYPTATEGETDDNNQGLIQELQLLSLENNTLKTKIVNLEKQKDEFLQNEFNPEYLKLQAEFNEKERENMNLQNKIDSLELKINGFHDEKLALSINK